MIISILDYLKTVNPNELKTSKKLLVRDLDEAEKNKFLAYVDEGNKSFDVQIILDVKQNIVSKTCDCGLSENCIHQTALILFLVSEKNLTTKVKKTTKRKVSETDALIASLDHEALKLWVSKILKGNGEIDFLFKTEFGQKNIIFDTETIKEIIAQSIQSVIGKRKKIETNEIKKVVDNLSISLQPVLDPIFANSINDKSFELISTIIDELHTFQMKYYFSSIRITRFIEKIYDSLLKSLYNGKDFERWKENVQFYFTLVFGKRLFSHYNFQLVKNIYSFSEINTLQREFVVNLVEEKFAALNNTSGDEYSRVIMEFDLFFLTVFTENNLFENYYTRIRPRLFQNQFNILLIENLIKINKLQLAESYCLEQINANSNRTYDIPYVNYLMEIYALNGEL
jgi:hypothetical protein